MQNRREFLSNPAKGIASSSGTESESVTQDSDSEIKPVKGWEERMKAPDDGKKFGWFIDTRRCFGCHGCEVACKAENEVPLGNYIRQTFYKDVGDFPKVARMFMPMACQHCEDAPCLKACPSAAIKKGVGGTVVIDYNKCDGEAQCVKACPYGAIYIDQESDQAIKCHNCYHRIEHDMEPACAATCPSDAIYFGDLNDPESKVSKAKSEATANDVELVQLRAEKETNPRMWFAGPAPAEIEERIPREGESYSPEAYNIYNWKEEKSDE
jgi:tetrathionate reductase subunit B